MGKLMHQPTKHPVVGLNLVSRLLVSHTHLIDSREMELVHRVVMVNLDEIVVLEGIGIGLETNPIQLVRRSSHGEIERPLVTKAVDASLDLSADEEAIAVGETTPTILPLGRRMRTHPPCRKTDLNHRGPTPTTKVGPGRSRSHTSRPSRPVVRHARIPVHNRSLWE